LRGDEQRELWSFLRWRAQQAAPLRPKGCEGGAVHSCYIVANFVKIFRPRHENALAIQFHREADLFRAVSTVVPPYYGVA
jgi:hypothetical protein